MDQIIKTFLGLFMAFLVALFGIFAIYTATVEKNAEAFLSGCVNKIEAANFADSVIEECGTVCREDEDLKNRGYRLSILTYVSAGNPQARYGKATLSYDCSILPFRQARTKTISMDIR